MAAKNDQLTEKSNKSKRFKKKRSLEDGGQEQKKKFKKQKKDDTLLSQQVEPENVDETIDENFDAHGQVEDVKKKPSKRQLKREKAAKLQEDIKETSKLQSIEKALNYISKWKHARSQWKFEKVKQIWLINNLLDDTCIPDDHFPTTLEYFINCKGQARKQLADKAMKVIKKTEDNIEGDEKEVDESVEYKRARQLLQALPTEEN